MIMAMTWLYPIADVRDPRFSSYFRFLTITCVILSFMLCKVNVWIGLFLLASMISSIYPVSTPHSTVAVRAVFVGCLFFYFVCQVPYKGVGNLMDGIAILAIINSIMLIFQYIGIDPIFKPRFGGLPPEVGFLHNPNETAAFLAICLPAFFRHGWAWFIPLVVVGAFCTQTSGGMVAMCGAASVYLLLSDIPLSWKIMGGCITAALCVLYIELKEGALVPESLQLRMKVWGISWDKYKKHPWIGYGIGHWKILFSRIIVKGSVWRSAHNEYVQGAVELGVSFPVLVAGYIARLFIVYRKELILPVSAIAAIIISSCVHFTFHIAQTAMVALAWMGIFEIIRGEVKCQTIKS